jgi:hypothetical protein
MSLKLQVCKQLIHEAVLNIYSYLGVRVILKLS